jgi:hypothetical protein
MPEISSASFSETDAANNNAAPNGFPEGMPPSGVNDAARAVMGALKRFWGRIQGANASTGSANAYVLTPSAALAAYVTGERYSFRASFANTGAATLNISGLGAKTIKKMSPFGKADLAANDIVNLSPVTVEYDGTDLILCTPVANIANAASETVAGVAEIATQAETNAGTDDVRFVTPLKMTATSATAHSFATALPRSYLAGYGLANNATDATNDIDIAVGAARDDGNAANIVLASALTKQLDAAWAVGTNAGLLDTGAVANNTYHLFAIRRPDTGVVDILASLSPTSPTMPTNYTQKRRIGSILRTAGANVAFAQDGDLFQRNASVLDVAALNPGSSAVTRTLSVPTGINLLAQMQVVLFDSTNATSPSSAYISDLAVSDEAPTHGTTALADVITGDDAGADDANGAVFRSVRTNTSAQVRSRVGGGSTSVTLGIRTFGWIDRRGRDA